MSYIMYTKYFWFSVPSNEASDKNKCSCCTNVFKNVKGLVNHIKIKHLGLEENNGTDQN